MGEQLVDAGQPEDVYKRQPQCREDLLCLDPSLQEIFSRMDFIQYTFPLQDRLYEEKVRAGILTRDE